MTFATAPKTSARLGLTNTSRFIWLACATFALLFMWSVSVHAQTHVFNNGSSTNIISPSGITTINRTGNGYTVISPEGVTMVNRFGNGNYNIVGPNGFTSVFSNGSSDYTVIGDANVVPVVPIVPDGPGGFTAIGDGGSVGEILPAGDGGLLLIGN